MNFKHDDSTFTWPRSHAAPKLLIPGNPNYSKFNTNLARIKQIIKKNNNDKSKKLTNLIQMFLNPENTFTHDKHVIDTIREEPPFESMLLTEPPPKTVDVHDTNEIITDAPLSTVTEIIEVEEPFWVGCLPHVCLVTLLVLYLAIGTCIYQLIDPAYAAKPYHTVLTMSFQVCFTIGWGNIPPLIGISRLFTLVYAAFGVPLTFAVVSNFGRFLAQGYGVKCLFLSNLCHPKDHHKRQQLVLKDALCLLLLHQFIGIILFNTWYGKIGVIEAWYFIWVTSAMIGFGDIIPDPKSLFQAITMCIYFAIGNLLMQAFLLSICYHLHRAYFVILKLYLFKVKNFFLKKFGETP